MLEKCWICCWFQYTVGNCVGFSEGRSVLIGCRLGIGVGVFDVTSSSKFLKKHPNIPEKERKKKIKREKNK